MSYIRSAFEAICHEAKPAERWYVTLVESSQSYGGPEEGGWWYTVNSLEAWQEFPSRDIAEAAAERVRQLADDLQAEARRSHGELCLQQLDWLEARGLDADFLPENDGPAEYAVNVTDELPVFDNSRPCYC